MNEWKKGKIPESAGDEPEGGNTAAKIANCRVQDTWVQIPSQPVSGWGTLHKFCH